jgi:hypothetical protein
VKISINTTVDIDGCCCKEHNKRGVRLFVGPFSTGRLVFSMGSITAPNGATGSLALKPLPDGASFTGAPLLSSSDPSVVAVTDNGDGTGSFQVVGTDGQTAVITGQDDAFSDTVTVTVAPTPPPVETGVQLTATLNP